MEEGTTFTLLRFHNQGFISVSLIFLNIDAVTVTYLDQCYPANHAT